MLDIKFIRENKDLVKEAAKKKKIDINIDDLLAIDDKRLAVMQDVESMRRQQNEASEKIARNDVDKDSILVQMQDLKKNLSAQEDALKEVMVEWRSLMLRVPNVPDISVPDGDSDSDNVELRTWGEIRKFDFTPKSQVELSEYLGIADFERGTKAAGFRGYYLKGAGATLSFALWQFTVDKLKSRGYIPLIAPAMVRKESFIGTGYLPQSEEDLYKTQDDLYLAGTAEVGTMAYFMDEVLDRKDLPTKFVAFSPCYRREAGSHGKDTKGLVRVHEFYKVEQVILCEANHETSVSLHEELLANSEEIMQDLKIPYRVVLNCGADIGLGQVKKYDIEAWVPSEGKYRETHSASYFHDFQTRRLNIKYRDEEGKMRFVHSLNNTALATPRLLVPLIENYQQADGTVKVPDVLVKYIGTDIIRPS